jgi:hypothetical protein
MRTVHNSKAYPTAFRATPPVTRLVLSGTTIRGKRHESVMSIVMGKGERHESVVSIVMERGWNIEWDQLSAQNGLVILIFSVIIVRKVGYQYLQS